MREVNKQEYLKPCPFCGGEVYLNISDDEGNCRDGDYESDPWSGLTYTIQHNYEDNKKCPIASYSREEGGMLGVHLYESREEAMEYWNTRKGE